MKLAAWGGFVSVVCGILAMVPVLPLLRHIPGYLGVFVVSPVMIGVIGGVGMLLGKLVPVEGTFFEPPASAATLAGRPTEIADEK